MFFPLALQHFTQQGQLWALPDRIQVGTIRYHKALFDAAGVPYLAPDWTTSDFLNTAVALTVGEDEATKQYGFLPNSFEASDLHIFLELQGAQFIDASSDPPAFTLDHPTTVAALRWYIDLSTVYGVKPAFATGPENSMAEFERHGALLAAGRAVMWIDFGFGTLEDDAADPDYGIVPLPVGPGGQYGSYQSLSGYFISAETEVQQACWEWITFLTGQPVIVTADSNNSSLPARIEVAESATYRGIVGEERAAANLSSLANVRQVPLFERLSSENGWLGTAYWWLADAYGQVVNEGQRVEDALVNVQEKATAYRACLITNHAFSDVGKQQDCLREADDSLPEFLYGTDGEP